MRTLAGWCVRHRRLVVTGWVVALVGLTVISQGLGSSYKDSFSLPGTQSFEALNLLQRAAPRAAGDREQIVVAVKQGEVTDPAVRSRVQAMLTKVAALPDVASVASPYGTTAAAQISSSGRRLRPGPVSGLPVWVPLRRWSFSSWCSARCWPRRCRC